MPRHDPGRAAARLARLAGLPTLALMLALSGCAGAGALMDEGVAEIRQVNDAVIPRHIDALCFYPHSALVRHAARAPLDGAFLAEKCGELNSRRIVIQRE
ncbi:hypothetical protein [Oceanibacterium hippocampi]|uniref:Lipoprotein n=1 Tax=Oceanibacterium hippocampi TaxID=745714 RepID=A0A1Y5S360_9PROT|nr:hypothetical protein [Oceanibacterium hippocampi]SLN31676.1 hypothetical protein OCH7691_01135 [Oceanibacterium hippocampi]